MTTVHHVQYSRFDIMSYHWCMWSSLHDLHFLVFSSTHVQMNLRLMRGVDFPVPVTPTRCEMRYGEMRQSRFSQVVCLTLDESSCAQSMVFVEDVARIIKFQWAAKLKEDCHPGQWDVSDCAGNTLISIAPWTLNSIDSTKSCLENELPSNVSIKSVSHVGFQRCNWTIGFRRRFRGVQWSSIVSIDSKLYLQVHASDVWILVRCHTDLYHQRLVETKWIISDCKVQYHCKYEMLCCPVDFIQGMKEWIIQQCCFRLQRWVDLLNFPSLHVGSLAACAFADGSYVEKPWTPASSQWQWVHYHDSRYHSISFCFTSIHFVLQILERKQSICFLTQSHWPGQMQTNIFMCLVDLSCPGDQTSHHYIMPHSNGADTWRARQVGTRRNGCNFSNDHPEKIRKVGKATSKSSKTDNLLEGFGR